MPEVRADMHLLPPASFNKKSPLVAPCALLLVGIAVLIEFWPAEGIQAYQDRAVPEIVLGRDKVTRRNAAFLRLGMLEMSPDFCAADELAASSPEALALYGQPCPAPDEKRLQGELPPSTALLPPLTSKVPEGVTVVSLVCRSTDLFDPRHGIVTHPLIYGRESERPAWFSARLGSKMIVESPVGLRIHGGHSRQLPNKSFAVLFRENYGGHALSPPGLFFGADTPASRHIILMNAAHPSRFNGALATEIATLAGCKTSRCTPAVVYLNGTEIKAPFFLYEHQSPDFVAGRFGLDEVDWVRLKAREPVDSEAYIAWRRWIRRPRANILMSEEAARFDLDDLSSWALAITFTATGDGNQGAYFRDRKHPSAVWQSLTWDMDWAFDNSTYLASSGPINSAERPFEVLIGDRARLFRRLMENSAEYRVYFRRFVEQKLSHEMTQEKIMELMDRYEKLARAHPSASAKLQEVMAQSRVFLKGRRAAYLKCLSEYLRSIESVGGVPVAER